MIIKHNLSASNTNRMLGIAASIQSKLTEKLSSGYSINRACDDAAGLSISEKMRLQIRGLEQGRANIEDGISLIQVADGALEEVNEMLQRMNVLSVQAANGTNSESDRSHIQNEIHALVTEIDRIGKTTTFNDKKIFAPKNEHIDMTNGTHGSTGKQLRIIGKPTDAAITSYTLTAVSVNGISINGTTIGWKDIKNQSGNHLAASTTAGNYSFTFNGLTLSFDVAAGEALDTIADSLDGLSFTLPPHHTSNKVTQTTMGNANLPPIFYVYNGDNFVDLSKAGTCEITADSLGLTITNRKTGAVSTLDFYMDTDKNGDLYEDIFQAGTAASITFELPDTPYSLTVDLQTGWTKQDIIDALNDATYDTSITGNMKEPIVSPQFAGGHGIDTSNMGVLSQFDPSFFTGYGIDLTELDRDANAFHGQFVENTDGSFRIDLKRTDGTGKTTSFQLQNTAALQAGNWNAGDEIPLIFADTAGNTMNISLYATRRITYSDLKNLLNDKDTEISDFRGTSLYQQSNFNSFASRGYDITASRQTPSSDLTNEYYEGEEIRIQCSSNLGDYLMIKIGAMDSKVIGIHNISLASQSAADNAIDSISTALERISAQRSRLGAYQNRLEHAEKNNANTAENTQYAESKIRDTDMASYMVQYSNNQIIMNAGQSMLAQSNQINQGILTLLK